jgi:hypothetical protein
MESWISLNYERIKERGKNASKKHICGFHSRNADLSTKTKTMKRPVEISGQQLSTQG